MYKTNAMTLKEYIELIKYIEINHSFSKLKGKHIKYIEHSFDFRTNTVFCVKLRPVCGYEVIFSTTHNDRNLKECIYEWLEEE